MVVLQKQAAYTIVHEHLVMVASVNDQVSKCTGTLYIIFVMIFLSEHGV